MSGLRFYALGFVGFLRYGLLSLLEDVPRHAGLRFVTTVGGSCATCGELRAVGSAGSEDGQRGLDAKIGSGRKWSLECARSGSRTSCGCGGDSGVGKGVGIDFG